jgi:flagellar motility protein MotE (MotC chaperone)
MTGRIELEDSTGRPQSYPCAGLPSASLDLPQGNRPATPAQRCLLNKALSYMAFGRRITEGSPNFKDVVLATSRKDLAGREWNAMIVSVDADGKDLRYVGGLATAAFKNAKAESEGIDGITPLQQKKSALLKEIQEVSAKIRDLQNKQKEELKRLVSEGHRIRWTRAALRTSS